jgi:hypothetical protein
LAFFVEELGLAVNLSFVIYKLSYLHKRCFPKRLACIQRALLLVMACSLQACFGASLIPTKNWYSKLVLITKLGGNTIGDAEPKQDHEDQESFVRRLQKIAAKKMLHASGWHERFLVVELVDNKALVHWVPEEQVKAVNVLVGFDRPGHPRIGYNLRNVVKCRVFNGLSSNELLTDARRALEKHVTTPFEVHYHGKTLLCDLPNHDKFIRVSWLVYNSPKFGDVFYLQRGCTVEQLYQELAARYNASQFCFRVLDIWDRVIHKLPSGDYFFKCVDDMPFRTVTFGRATFGPRLTPSGIGLSAPTFRIFVSDQDTLSSVKLKILKLQHICVDSIWHVLTSRSKVTDVTELRHGYEYLIVPKEATQEQKDEFLVGPPDFQWNTFVDPKQEATKEAQQEILQEPNQESPHGARQEVTILQSDSASKQCGCAVL